MSGSVYFPKSAAFIGFDSAWTDNPKAPGAICAVIFDGSGTPIFFTPKLVDFFRAAHIIQDLSRANKYCLIAIDQPTVVPNQAGCRPVDRVAGSVVNFGGGGVQPANRSKKKMFGDDAPIWRFKNSILADENPDAARTEKFGRFIIEVFPALALPALEVAFFGHRNLPKYNPSNKKFNYKDWKLVNMSVSHHFETMHLLEAADWVATNGDNATPKKFHQDMLDACICALIGLIWALAPKSASIMIGDLYQGYMITPVSSETHSRLSVAASRRGVPFS